MLYWSREYLEGLQRVTDSLGSQEGLLETCAELFMSTFEENDLPCLLCALVRGIVGSYWKMKYLDCRRGETHNFL